MIIIFSRFFSNLCKIADIRQAFDNVCLKKLALDGYVDMNAYISGRIKKDDMYASLKTYNSKYTNLYSNSYPKQNTVLEVWSKAIWKDSSRDDESVPELTFEESVAIVNWVYRSLNNTRDRTDFTRELFEYFKDLEYFKIPYGALEKISFNRGVVYNAEKVEVYFFSSVSGVSTFISSLKKRD